MKVNENCEWTQSGLKTETEYVLSQEEWDEMQARSEDLHLWKLAVDHRLVTAGCNTADSYSTPAEALDALIKQEIALATDPLINEGTNDDT